MNKEPEEIAELLRNIFGLDESDSVTVTGLVRMFQRIHGLQVDGVVGPVTERYLDMPRFCGVPDRETVASQRCRWDHTKWDGTQFSTPTPVAMNINYFVQQPAPNLSMQQTSVCAAAAFAEIAAHAAVQFTALAAPTGANVFIKFGHIDGPSATLAYTELPCGPDTPQKLLDFLADNEEPWVDSADPSNGRIDFRRVLIHEMLHLMGLEHGPQGNIMAPYYDRTIRTMQAWDIQELQTRYGPPLTSHPPPPQGGATCTVLLPNGQSWAGALQPTAG